ncbi:MAG: transcriptional repressor LexA [Nitrospinota bacterium]
MHRDLTKRQKSILDFLKEYLEDRGYPPSLMEICTRFRINAPKNARKHLEALERKGYIKRSPNISRAIEITSSPLKNAVSIPIVGRVKAGAPNLAVEDIQGYVTLDSQFFNCRDAFLLKVEGNSMIDAGIDDGDYVIVKPHKNPSNGEIIVVLLDDEATVKRFYKKGDVIILKPENPDLEPIKIKRGEKEVDIIGKVISAIKLIEKR